MCGNWNHCYLISLWFENDVQKYSFWTSTWQCFVNAIHPAESCDVCICVYVFSHECTGVHPCSCKSKSLPAPDTHLTNTDSRAPCNTCITRWVGRGGVGIRCFSNIHLRLTRPSVLKKSKQYVFEKNMVMFTPNSDQFRGIWGPPSENKNESWHKTDRCNVLSECW